MYFILSAFKGQLVFDGVLQMFLAVLKIYIYHIFNYKYVCKFQTDISKNSHVIKYDRFLKLYFELTLLH